jgi:3-(3-hydroxy-phenyl)propionate hydroxylase
MNGRFALLDELTGAGLCVALDEKFPALTIDQRQRVADLDGKVIRFTAATSLDGATSYSECDSVARNWFALNNCGAAVVRPDHYVFGAASDSEALTEALAEYALSLS